MYADTISHIHIYPYIRQGFPLLDNPNDLDPSYRMEIYLLDFGREKQPSEEMAKTLPKDNIALISRVHFKI